jgi:iron complex transport system substrate-binding protein
MKRYFHANRIASFRAMMGIMMAILFPVAALAAGGPAHRSVTDPVGRAVIVPCEPRRMIALAPSVTEVIYALGCQDRLVGVSLFSDFPKEAEKLPKVGSYVHLDVERIAALRPDLCIGIKDGNPLAVVSQLNALDIPVFAIDPHGLDSVMESVTAIGGLIHAEEAAERINSAMRKRIEDITSRVVRARHKPKVFFQIGVSPIVSVGSATFIHELIVLAGGTNVSAGGTAYPRFSKEQVIGMAPDVMVISSMARKAVFEKVKAEWEQWPAIPAVRNKSIFIAPTNIFDRPTPRLVEGLELLARLIHPELFPETSETRP